MIIFDDKTFEIKCFGSNAIKMLEFMAKYIESNISDCKDKPLLGCWAKDLFDFLVLYNNEFDSLPWYIRKIDKDILLSVVNAVRLYGGINEKQEYLEECVKFELPTEEVEEVLKDKDNELFNKRSAETLVRVDPLNTGKGSNLAIEMEKSVLRYSGNDTKEIIFYIAKHIFQDCKSWRDKKVNLSNPNELFVIKQSRNVNMYLQQANLGYVDLTGEEKFELVECLREIGMRYHIDEYFPKEAKGSSIDSFKRVLEISNKLYSKIPFAKVARRISNTSNSIYLMLDNRVLASIRISTHVSTKYSKYNIILSDDEYKTETVKQEETKNKEYFVYYVTEDTVDQVVDDVVCKLLKNKKDKIKKTGNSEYNHQVYCNNHLPKENGYIVLR